MSISDTLSGVGSAVLVGLQTGDPGTAGQIGAAGSRAQEVATLLASLQPHLGQNVNTAV